MKRSPRRNRDKLPGGSGDSHSQKTPTLGNITAMPTPPAGSPVAAQATRFGERLLAEGLIDEIQLNRALDAQRLSGYPLGFVMLGLGLLDEDTITVELGAHLDMPVADLRTMTVDHEVVRLVPEEFARRNVLLPIGRDNGHLAVAMVDPTNLLLLNDLRLITGLPIEPHLATRSDILANLSRIHSMRPRINEAAKSLQESRPQLRVDRSASLDLSAITASSPAVETEQGAESGEAEASSPAAELEAALAEAEAALARVTAAERPAARQPGARTGWRPGERKGW